MQIHVARNGIDLGMFEVSDAEELLTNGFFLPSDMFWTAEHSEPRRLDQLPTIARPATSTAKKIALSLLGSADTLRQKAANITARVAESVGHQKKDVEAVKNRLLQDSLPRLKSSVATVFSATSQTVESALRDEPFLRKLFGAVYEAIPRSVQRFVPEHTFVEFCLRNRNRLLEKQSATRETGENHL